MKRSLAPMLALLSAAALAHEPAAPGATTRPDAHAPAVTWSDPADEELSIRSAMGLDGYQVAYKDVDGTTIDFPQFSAGLAAGHTFSALKDTERKKATLGLEPKDAAPDGDTPPGDATPPGAERPTVLWIDEETLEPAMWKGMGLDGYTVAYRNTDGTPLSFQQFSAALATGRSFDITKNPTGKTAVLTLGIERGTPPDAPVTNSVGPGDALPAFKLQTLDGRSIDNASLDGRPTLLSFHFAECVPCIAEIPMLNAFARGNPDFNVFAVTFDDAATSTAFATAHGYDWPILADAQDFIDTLGIRVYPTMLLVDATGIVRARESGSERLTDDIRLREWARDALDGAR